MSGEEIDAPLVVADLRGPQTLDLNSIDRMRHAPAIDPRPTVGERHRRELYPQTFKLGDKGFDIEIRHFNSHPPTTPHLAPTLTLLYRCDKSMTVKAFPRNSRFPLQCWVANTIHSYHRRRRIWTATW